MSIYRSIMRDNVGLVPLDGMCTKACAITGSVAGAIDGIARAAKRPMLRLKLLTQIVVSLLLGSFCLQAQVQCTQVAGNSVTITEAPESYGVSGTVRLTYTWDASRTSGVASASVPRNAIVSSIGIATGPSN